MFVQRQIGRSLMAIAAVIIAALVIGSVLWVSNIATHSSQVGASPAQTTLSQGQRQIDQQQTVQTPSGVYIGESGGVARVDTQTGKVLWKYNYPQAQFSGLVYTENIIAIGNAIYVGLIFTQSGKPAVLAIDAQTGKPLWSYALTNGSLSNLTASNGTLYVRAQNSIYALDATNGTQRASYNMSAQMNGGTVQTLSVSNGTLYIGASNGLHALNLSDGKQLWYTPIGGNQVGITTPHIVNDVLYTTIDNGNESAPGQLTATVAAFKASTGEKLWQSDAIQNQMSDIAVANNKVFVGTMTANTPSFKGGMNAYDAQSGKLLWNTPLDGTVKSAPSIDNGIVYASAYADPLKPEEVAALNIADGSIKWKAQIAAGFMTTPTVVNGVVYVSTSHQNNGTTTALNSTNGSLVWADPALSSPEVVLVAG